MKAAEPIHPPRCDVWQIHAEGTKNYRTPEGIRVAPARELLRTLV